MPIMKLKEAFEALTEAHNEIICGLYDNPGDERLIKISREMLELIYALSLMIKN